MFEKVLVPLDGSSVAEAILPYITRLAGGLTIPVVVLVVAGRGSRQSEEVQNRLEAYLRKVSDDLRGQGVQATSMSAVGAPAEEVVRVAEAQACSLIALSTHSETLVGRGLLGNVTVKVLHTSPVPILTLSPDKAKQYAQAPGERPQIIVPLDGSPFAESALPYAEELAQKLNWNIVLVRAFSPAYLAADPFATAAVDLGAAVESDAVAYLESAHKKLTAEGLSVQAKVFEGDPAQHIVEYARTVPHSITVMTTHGRSALARWLLGSVAEAVVRTSADAVLTIPRQYGRRQTLEVTDILAQASIFSGLDGRDLDTLAQAARIRVYRPGDIIVKQGDTTGGIFIVSTGKVEVVKNDGTALGTLGPGEFFGEMSIIDDHPRSATVRVLEDTECVAIRRVDFLVELQNRPEIAVHMLPVLVQRLREARAQLTE